MYCSICALQGRWLLPVLLAHWVLTLLASIMGLSAGGEPTSAVYEYEPLRSGEPVSV